jgi:hypothetical protein
MDQYEIDYLHDENKASRTLVMHLAATEAYYQSFTFFETREFMKKKKKWDAALELDKGAHSR